MTARWRSELSVGAQQASKQVVASQPALAGRLQLGESRQSMHAWLVEEGR